MSSAAGKLTILHTIETAGPGGAETVVLELASRLDPQRFRSIVLLPYWDWLGSKLSCRNVLTELVPSRAWYDFGTLRGLIRLTRREKVDVIHSHLPDQNFYTSLAGCLTGCKTVATYHGPVELQDCDSLKAKIKLATVRNCASTIVTVCDFVAEKLKKLAFPPDRMLRVYNGIDVEKFRDVKEIGLRASIGLGSSSKLVGMVANIRESKGYGHFIRAAKELTALNESVHFVAVGDIDKTLGSPLFELVDRLSLPGRFHFLGFRDDVPGILKELDVVVLSSTSEGFPLVILEAMASGKPVVVTRCGGTEEIVDDGRTGFLVAPADSHALAERVRELLENRDLASAMARNAKDKLEREFTLQGMVHKYEQLYERLAGSES